MLDSIQETCFTLFKKHSQFSKLNIFENGYFLNHFRMYIKLGLYRKNMMICIFSISC